MYTIHIYIPATKRTFTTLLHEVDILKWDYNFMRKITGVSEEKMSNINVDCKNYAEYHKRYLDSKEKALNIMIKPHLALYEKFDLLPKNKKTRSEVLVEQFIKTKNLKFLLNHEENFSYSGL